MNSYKHMHISYQNAVYALPSTVLPVLFLFLFHSLFHSLCLSKYTATTKHSILYDNQFFRLLRRCKIQYSEQEFIKIVQFQPMYTQTHVIPEKKRCHHTITHILLCVCIIYLHVLFIVHAVG